MRFLPILAGILFLASCNSNKKNEDRFAKMIFLHSDTINIVKLTDTLAISESTCRGCEFEGSTRFSLYDSLNVVALENVITSDNNSPDIAGGNVSKLLVVVPLKEGKTTARLYKFYGEKDPAKDSANVKSYSIEVIK